MDAIPRQEFYEGLCEFSPLFESIPLAEGAVDPYLRGPDGKPIGPDRRVNVVQLAHAQSVADKRTIQQVFHDHYPELVDLILIEMCEEIERNEFSVDSQDGHPFEVVLSLLGNLDPHERKLWTIVIHPAVWMDVRREADHLWYQAAVVEGPEKFVGGARLVVTPRMDDREVLMFRQDKVQIHLSDVDLSTTKTEPVAHRIRFLYRLQMDAAHAQLVHNLR